MGIRRAFLFAFAYASMAHASAFAEDFGTVDIADPNVALTFARIEQDGRHQLIAVTAYEDGELEGVDVTALLGADADDPIRAYATHGYDTLQAVAATPASLRVSVSELVMPVDLLQSHIAAGTNFPEHADESSVEDGPFLFPKEVVPTAFNAPIAAGDALLDYEVELCFVGLDDIELARAPERTGLLLCNDVTDRAKLMRHLDALDVASGKGFTTGKSAPGYMPVGNLFVIPREMRRFSEAVQLKLYVNGGLRQSARQSQAIWDFDELLRQIKARETVTWTYRDATVGLAVVDGHIPVRTAILGGTPSGTIFQGVDASSILLGTFDWLLSGWDEPLAHWVVERQIAAARDAGNYLQPADRVQIHADYLGELDNRVGE